MKRVYLLCSCLALLAILLSACAPQATPTVVPTEPPATQAPTEAPATEAAVTPTETLVPINLAGPEMAVGSKFQYVDGSTLVAVPGGTSLMGRGGGTDNPEHEVTLSDFWIYRTEVTNQQYAYCVAQGECSAPDLNDNPAYTVPERVGDPVTGVTWDQSQAYCEFVHGRLPTEAEWEKTASWDPVNNVKNIYPWGDGAPTCALTNFNNCVGKSTIVNQYPEGQSVYEALDMAGNSYEWVADWYDPFYYRNGAAEDPAGPEAGERRSIRSGSYKSSKDQVPSAVRAFDNPKTHTRDRGFRCVVEDPTYFAPICQIDVHYGLDANGSSGSGGGFVDCPDPTISQGSDCGQNNTPLSYVTVHVDAPSYFPPGGITGLESCNPGTNAADTVNACPIGVEINATAQCDPAAPGAPSCPPGWTMGGDGMSCVSDGGPGEACPTGYEYDPLLHCCSVVDGNSGWQCAAGFHEIGGVCVADVYGFVPPSPAHLVTFAEGNALNCGGGNNNPCDPATDPSCNPDSCEPATCTYPWSPSNDGCSCYCSWGPGKCG